MISILGCSWLPLPPCLPSLSPFMISILGCSWLPLPPCLSLHDLHSGLLLAAAAALSPKLVSLPDFPFGLLVAATAALSPSLFPFMISLPGESMVSEHLRIRNKKVLLYIKKTHFGNAIWGLCWCNYFEEPSK